MEELKLQPTVKSAIMFEEMTGKQFFSYDLSDADMVIFMYCVYTCTIDRISLEAFTKMFKNKKFASEVEVQWLRFNRFMAQFKDKVSENVENDDETGLKMCVSMKDVAKLLAFKYELDPHYVFSEVELWELDYLITIGEDAYRDKAEEKRLWTYFQVIPHLDPKKAKNMTPSKLFPFPWEENVHTKEGREKVLERETEGMKKTIGQHLDIEF